MSEIPSTNLCADLIPAVCRMTENPGLMEPAMHDVFKIWLMANSNLSLTTVPRADWNELYRNFPIITHDKKSTLFLPQDLKIWELPEVIRVLRIEGSAVPERDISPEIQAATQELGQFLEDAGIYLATEIHQSGLIEGRDIAISMGETFSRYGHDLVAVRSSGSTAVGTSKTSSRLSPDRQREIERWLLGDEMYKKRSTSAQHLAANAGIPLIEAEQRTRTRILRTFFHIAEKQMLRADDNAHPIGESLLKRVDVNLQHLITETERLKTTLKDDIFHTVYEQGLLLLRCELGIKSIDETNMTLAGMLEEQKGTFEEMIGIENKIKQLAHARKRAREQRDGTYIISAEASIVDELQRTLIEHFHYAKGVYRPNAIVDTQTMNCIGSTLIAADALKRLGIDCLQVVLSNHTLLAIRFSNGSWQWRDFTPGQSHSKTERQEEARERVLGDNRWGNIDRWDFKNQSSTIEAMDALSRNQGQPVRISFQDYGQIPPVVLNSLPRHQADRIKEAAASGASINHLTICLSDVTSAQKAVMLNSYAFELEKSGCTEAATQAWREACRIIPDLVFLKNLGKSLLRQHRLTEAARVFEQAIVIDPEDPSLHLLKGDTLPFPKDLSGTWKKDLQRKNTTYGTGYALSKRFEEAVARENYRHALSKCAIHQEKVVEFLKSHLSQSREPEKTVLKEYIQQAQFQKCHYLHELLVKRPPNHQDNSRKLTEDRHFYGYALRDLLHIYEDALSEREIELLIRDLEDPTSPEPVTSYTLAGIKLAEGEPEQAILLYKEAISIDPTFQTAYRQLAGCLYHTEHLDDAIISAQKALDLDPSDGVSWLVLGLSLRALGRFKEAEQACFEGFTLTKDQRDQDKLEYLRIEIIEQQSRG